MTCSLKHQREKIKMAKLKSKVVEETPVEVLEVVEETSSYMNEGDKEALEVAEQKKKDEGASTKRLELATGIVSSRFNLGDDYSVKKFDDKGKVVNMTLENDDFSINVTIKDSDRHGMYVAE